MYLKEVVTETWDTCLNSFCDSCTRDSHTTFGGTLQNAFRYSLDMRMRTINKQDVQAIEDHLKLSRIVAVLVPIDFGKGWVNQLPISHVFIPTTAITFSIQGRTISGKSTFMVESDRATCLLDRNWRSSNPRSRYLIQETTEKIIQIKQRMQALDDRQKEVPLDGLHLDDKLHFVEEPLEIVGCEVKWLKRSRIPLVKVRWNSKRGPEFTWERGRTIQEVSCPHLCHQGARRQSAVSRALRTRLV
ncbi:hypothetical protein Tco_1173630 [Tanacetum coccineum]